MKESAVVSEGMENWHWEAGAAYHGTGLVTLGIT